MSRFAIRRASFRIASSGSTPSRSSCRTRASSALAGSCAWSTTTPSAPLKLWPERSAEASTCRLPGNCSANSWRTAFTFRRTNDAGDQRRRQAEEAEERRREQQGDHEDRERARRAPCRRPGAPSPSSAPARGPARAPPTSPWRSGCAWPPEAPRTPRCRPACRGTRSRSSRRGRRPSSSGDAISSSNSPHTSSPKKSASTSGEPPESRNVETGERWYGRQQRRRRRDIRRRRLSLPGDLDLDVDLRHRARGRAVADEVLARELGAELLVDRRELRGRPCLGVGAAGALGDRAAAAPRRTRPSGDRR